MSLTLLIKQKLISKNNDIDQWQDGYPNEETIEKDIENNEAYVLEEDGVIFRNVYGNDSWRTCL